MISRAAIKQEFLASPDAQHLLTDVLMKEKEYVDKQISSNLAANLKIISFVVGAVVTGVGWLASSKHLDPRNVTVILLALVIFSGIGSMVGSIYNGFTFGFIAYKSLYLDPLFRDLIGLDFNPLRTSAFISSQPSRLPIILGTIGSAVLQLLLSWGLFFAAIEIHQQPSLPASAQSSTPEQLLTTSCFVIVGLVLAGATAVTVSTVYAMLKVRDEVLKEAKF